MLDGARGVWHSGAVTGEPVQSRLEGGCHCGSARWRAEADPTHRIVSHFETWRRSVGSHAEPTLTFPRDRFELRGESVRRYASLDGVVRTFCEICGTSLTYERPGSAREIDVTLATADARLAPNVADHIWTSEDLEWALSADSFPRARRAETRDVTSSERVRTWSSEKVARGRSGATQGRGVFAKVPIRSGELVLIKGGHLVDRKTLRALPERLQNSEIGIASGLHLVALNDDEYHDVMLYLNHSCEPNVGLNGNIVFVAMRDIDEGEELTIDYAMIDEDPDGEVLECQCGKPLCRRTISGRDWQRPELHQRYGRFFSSYLQARFAELGKAEELEAEGL